MKTDNVIGGLSLKPLESQTTADGPPPEDANTPPSLTEQRHLARTMMDPAVNAKRARLRWSGELGAPVDAGMLQELEAQISMVQAGNIDRPAALLAAHLESLDAVFYRLIEAAFLYRGTPMEEVLIKLALKVQARATAIARTLADLKNPRPVAYVQQANIGNAVQVNNQSAAAAAIENPPNKLLEKKRSEWMERQAASAAIAGDQELETMEAVHRPANGRG